MKYIWIVMLIIIEIIWFIFSLEDLIKTARFFKARYILSEVKVYTLTFIIVHLILLFGYSLAVYINGMK